MARRSKKFIICIIASFYICSLPSNKIMAEALPHVMESTATIADIVMSYYAVSGTAVANTDWINTLYSSLGSSFGTIEDLANQGYMIMNDAGNWEPLPALATAIEQTPAYTSLGLNEIFNVSSEEAGQITGAVAATGGGTLAGAAAGVASVGVLPLAGGVTVAYWGGIGIGTIISHCIDKYIDNILISARITTPNVQDLVALRYPNGYCGSYIINNNQIFVFVPQNVILCGYEANTSSGIYRYGYACKSGASKVYRRSDVSGEQSLSNYGNFTAGNGNHRTLNWPNMQNSESDYNNYRIGIVNGSIQGSNKKNDSPDLIGENGNLYADEIENGGYSVPDMKPQIDPGVEAGKPLRMQDWLNFANGVQNNNSGADPTGDNKQAFQDLLEDITTSRPNYNPDPNPDPDPDSYTPPVTTPVPDPDYDVPQQETQPDWENETTAETEPVPPSIPTGKPWIVEGLQNKFPFCIPWDIKNMFSKLNSGSRQAPYISWRFNPPNTPVDYTFNLDLSDFEDAASLLRTLELIAFIVGLAYATRYLIGAT